MGGDGLKAALSILDLVVDMADLPNKDELVARIRKINGQRDPGADLTQEEQQAMAQQQQEAQRQQAMAGRAQEANIALLEEKVAQLRKQGVKLGAEAISTIVSAVEQAMQAGATVVTAPGIVPIADEILSGAGFNHQMGA